MQTDLLKNAESILSEGDDTKDYKVLFVLEPTLELNKSFYENKGLGEYKAHDPVIYAAKSDEEIVSVDIINEQVDYVAPWFSHVSDDFMKLLEIGYKMTAITPEGHYCIWRYIAGNHDLKSVIGVKKYMDYCQINDITRYSLQKQLPKIHIPDIYEIEAWKPYVKKSRYYLDNSCLKDAENYLPICIFDKTYPENQEVFTIATNGKNLVTCHPTDFSMNRENAIQPADKELHEIFMEKLKSNFCIYHMETQAHTLLWNILPKYYPTETKEIQIYLSFCKANGVNVKKLQRASSVHIPDIMKFYGKSKYQQKER